MLSLVWHLILGLCVPSSLHVTRSSGEEILAWPGWPSPLLPPPHFSSSLVSWGRVRHKSRISSLCSLSPSLPVPSRAEGGQRKQRASPAPSLSLALPHFLLREDGLLTPLPRPGRTWPWCQVSVELPESKDWALTGPFISLHFTFFMSSPTPTQGYI